MAAPTASELVAAMASRGMTITEADATGILCLLAAITECLETSYPGDTCKQDAIMLWASVLIAANTAGRYVTSQHAPSGASQSFAYGSKPWVALYNQMKLLDTADCTGDLVEDPEDSAKPWFRVVTGSRCR
nr:MAG TPA: head to tail adaptor [Caudoviricetes sp.]